ncbi:hypothetical protein D0Z07_8708 [Hyphodiscus hymeniophilus]|uniref:Uncharacterized protein n=1 Tax=Hyphodiscus hymeniophilus TaxID=353542 RepID=A0A9P6VCG3_9HELO|nr:hypothetical protein D0Z07_8708 [Hyphodiscus hymeniophilus]
MEISSASDAEAHIAKIRQDKGLSETSPSGHNVSDLENALTTLSDQLYQSSTHFLLELIQNADDNSYNSNVQPSVQFTYANECLRVDCNETGFSPRNVEALCRVGQSTKKGGDDATRYVGEKGIGFKSVFKAADVVSVCSGYYSFKFDKNRQLGMIAPIWATFPALVKPGWTSFYLQLSGSYNRRGLLDELRSLDSRLLIFLRRLRKITISISEPRQKVWKSSFSRTETGQDLIHLEENNLFSDYIITRHQVPNMPQESKRPGASSSEIILGFPITNDGQPKRDSQQAYAFLPIRDYGFEASFSLMANHAQLQFLIQADFLLIASREDIDDSSQWNHALRSALSDAFVDTMRNFNNDEKLRYLWPRYLPIREPLQSFLKPFHLEVRRKLASQKILFSHSGDLAPPKSLTYVPEIFTFNGAPLTMNPQTSLRYLSARYPESDMDYLDSIGVQEMTEFAFFLEFSTLVLNSMDKFKAKSNAWHSHLATILMRLSPQHTSQLGNLTLVPLSDSSWAASGRRQILFPANNAEFELPGGLQLSVVDSAAASDPERRKLFKYLGVGNLEQEPVVRHIEDLHTKPFDSSSISHAAIISQIKFLYSTGWKNPTFQRFWFTSESGQRLRGPQLYQDSSKKQSATKFFGAHRSKFRFIHKDYMAAAGADRDLWARWLEERMGVATIPRLVTSTIDGGFKLAEDFEFIIKNFPSSEVLLLLRDNGEEYSKYLDPAQAKRWNGDFLDPTYESAQGSVCAVALKEKLSSMLVSCTTGKKCRLDTTFLPSKELLVASQDGTPFVDIPDGNDTRWQMLEMLGVSIKVDVSFFLRGLERLQAEHSEDGDRVDKILNMIQLRCDDEAEASIVKTTFGKKNLVFIPSTRHGVRPKWNTLSRCRWKGPPIGKNSQGLRSFVGLKDLYPENRRLFCDILGIKDASLKDLVHEAKYWAVEDSLDHITGLLHTMEKLLEDENKPSPQNHLIELSKHKIFPVSKNWNLDTDRVSALQDAKLSTEWFIADTTPFRTIFAGVVPLLDISVDKLPEMDQVLEKIGLKGRFLSKHTESVPGIQGSVVFNQELTDAFRSKVNFIIRSVKPYPDSHFILTAHGKGVNCSVVLALYDPVNELQNLEVYTADEVIQEWCVSYKGKKMKGPPGNGKVAMVAEKGVLRVYLAAKSGIELDETPMELVDEIFNYCGMLAHNPEHSEMCLHITMSQSNSSRISKVFADKGIPSLESLEFADADDNEKKDDKEGPLPPRYSEGGGTQKTSRTFGNLTVTQSIFAIPAGIAFGLGALFKSRRHFDGEVPKHDALKASKGKSAKTTSKGENTKAHASKKQPGEGPTGLQNFHKSFSKGLLRLRVACISNSDEDVAFMGEFAVHEALAETLGQSYNPSQHWTSKLRSKANIPTFSNDQKATSTFKFADVSGTFTQLLKDGQYPGASSWVTHPPTYHIDVKSTRGDVHSEFYVSPVQFQRARDLSIMMQQMKGDIDSIPTDVYIIVRVYDVDVNAASEKGKGKETSKMVFLVDPWE